jgi:hypothetical protein
MLDPEKDPPNYTAWMQHRDRGKFREWYKCGHAWFETAPDGKIIARAFRAVPTVRGDDGFIHYYPVGVEPPPPPPPKMQAHRPGAQQPTESDGEGF